MVVRQPRVFQVSSRRGFADEKDPKHVGGPNESGLGHVSEEAADMGRVTGETKLDPGQGTPVQEVCLRAQWQELRCYDIGPENM